MVTDTTLLFLLGTIYASTAAIPIEPTEIIIEKHIEPKLVDKLTQYGLRGYPPFISNFMEHGTNIFFKPHIVLSPALPTGQKLIVNYNEDCKEQPMAPVNPFVVTPHEFSDEPLKVIETVVSGGELPAVEKVVIINPSPHKTAELDTPIVFSPLPEITEKIVEVPVSNPIVFEQVDDAFPSLEIVEEKPAFVPETPELPPLSVSEAIDTSLPSVPVHEPVQFIESHNNIVSLDIPEPPKLPPYTPPKLPFPVVVPTIVPEAPEFPPLSVHEVLDTSLPSVPVLEPVPCVESHNNVLSIDIPEASKVPPYTPSKLEPPVVIQAPFPEAPELPPLSMHEALDSSLPSVPVFEPEPFIESHNNIVSFDIPEAPKLPPYTPPKLPLPVFIPAPIPEAPELPPLSMPESFDSSLPSVPVFEPEPFIESHNNIVSLDIPEAPKLPPYTPPKLPLPVFIPAHIPEKPELPPLSVPEALDSSLPSVPVFDPVPFIESQNNVVSFDIPEAPKLPPYTPPKLPLPVFIPAPIHEAPELPLLSMPESLDSSLPTVPELEPVPYIESHNNVVSFDIPEAPKLPPYTPPQLPLPVVMTEVLIDCHKENKTQSLGNAPVLIESQETMLESLEPLIIPPPLALPPSDEVIVSQPVLEEKPVNIPPAPVLSESQGTLLMDTPIAGEALSHQGEIKPIFPTTMPDLAELTPEHAPDFTFNLVNPEQVIAVPELPHLTDTQLVEIPAPPVLPPMEPISLPVSAIAEEPISAPESPPPCSNEKPNAESPEYGGPILIPETPFLSNFAISKETVQKETLNNPAAHQLSPLSFPFKPIAIKVPMGDLYTPGLTPMFIEPKLPELLGNRALFMTFAEQVRLPLSEMESVVSFPTSCVQNIVLERILPNIVKERKFQVFSSSNYPVLSSQAPIIGRIF